MLYLGPLELNTYLITFLLFLSTDTRKFDLQRKRQIEPPKGHQSKRKHSPNMYVNTDSEF